MKYKRNQGSRNPNWKGGRHITKEGYVLVKCYGHPHPKHGNYVYEHRLVMERRLKRFLKPKEIVHHINGNNSDNRLKNLSLLKNQSEHRSLHPKKNKISIYVKCLLCQKLILQYPYKKRKYCSKRCHNISMKKTKIL